MGVCRYLVCKDCKEYIDIHKSTNYKEIIESNFPPFDGRQADQMYWTGRAIWFGWKHRLHKDLYFDSDTNDNWWEIAGTLTEVFPHTEDLKLRARKENQV